MQLWQVLLFSYAKEGMQAGWSFETELDKSRKYVWQYVAETVIEMCFFHKKKKNPEMKIVSRNKHSLFSTKEQVGQDGTVTEVICL